MNIFTRIAAKIPPALSLSTTNARAEWSPFMSRNGERAGNALTNKAMALHGGASTNPADGNVGLLVVGLLPSMVKRSSAPGTAAAIMVRLPLPLATAVTTGVAT